ncbi:general stress protein [Bacillus salacetis]|uniref:general stress protein n=1 Tax=Bacillus salacetis TaxID=2315464 RepID=UPI003BA14C10
MEKSIVGAYDSTTEVMDVINSLTKDGYNEDDILVISNRNDIDRLDNTSGLHVEHPEGHHERSLWEKIKDSFAVREHEGSDNDLAQYEIPLNQVGTYQSKLDDGKILVAVTATDKYVLSHGGEVVDAGANIKPVSDDEDILEDDDDMRNVNEVRNQTSTENYRNSPTAGKSVGNHGAEPEDIRSGNVDTNEDTIGGNVGNTLGGKLGTSERYSTGQAGLENSTNDQTEKEYQDEKNAEHLNEKEQKERFKGNDYRGDF